jgi:hypothetical protein
MLVFHILIEITNIKFQRPKFENADNFSSKNVLIIEHLNLRFVCNLIFGICILDGIIYPKVIHSDLDPKDRIFQWNKLI